MNNPILESQSDQAKTIYYSGDVKCGGGKTRGMLETLAGYYLQCVVNGVEQETTVIACKTIDLASQSRNNLHSLISDMLVDSDGFPFPTTLVSHESASAIGETTVQHLMAQLKEFKGVVFCTHAALGLLNQRELLADKHVIIDEVPSHELAGIMHLSTTDEATFNLWSCYLEYTVLSQEDLNRKGQHKAVYKVSIREDMKEALQQRMNDRDSGLDNSISDSAYYIFHYLVNKPEVEVLYRRKKNSNTFCMPDGSTIEKYEYIFEAVDSSRLKALYEKAMRVTFLAASFQSSLVHFLTTEILNYNLEVDESVCGELEAKHSTNIVLLPLLADPKMKWSKYFRKQKANERIVGAEHEDDSFLVQDYVLRLVQSKLKQDYLLFVNNDIRSSVDVNAMAEQSNTQVLTTAIHGMNSFTGFNKAAFLASLNLTNDERSLLMRYASAYGAVSQDLVDAVQAERAYEACYQCVMRTAGRKDDFTGTVFAFVPDMHHAEYVKSRFNEGYCHIDTRFSLFLKESTATKDRENARLQRAIAYFTAVKDKPKGTKVGDIQKQFEVKRQTVSDWKKQFTDELQARGLIAMVACRQ